MDYSEKILLGRTGLTVGRLGLGAAYGAPAHSFEEAFEKGCNYFYYGASRKKGMSTAVKNICANGKRDGLVVAVQSFSRSSSYLEPSIKKALKQLGIQYADILILGWHNKKPSARIIDKALDLKERGMVRYLGLSGHNRKLFPKICNDVFDIFHVRYNAVHRGAEKDLFPELPKKNRPGIGAFTATCWGKLLKPGNMPEGEAVLKASDCYRFAMSNPDVDICMTGPKNAAQMKEALKAIELGPLDSQEMERICRTGRHIYKKKKRFIIA